MTQASLPLFLWSNDGEKWPKILGSKNHGEEDDARRFDSELSLQVLMFLRLRKHYGFIDPTLSMVVKKRQEIFKFTFIISLQVLILETFNSEHSNCISSQQDIIDSIDTFLSHSFTLGHKLCHLWSWEAKDDRRFWVDEKR